MNTVLADNNTEKIATEAKRIANRLLVSAGETEPSFDPWLIAEYMDVNVNYSDLLDTYGLSYDCPTGFFVELPSQNKDSFGKITRQRYTLAHELGHVVIEKSRNQLQKQRSLNEKYVFLSELTGKSMERFCDIFARELLMPEKSFLRFAHSIHMDNLGLSKLASIFQTSIPATMMRVKETMAWPHILLSFPQIYTFDSNPTQNYINVESCLNCYTELKCLSFNGFEVLRNEVSSRQAGSNSSHTICFEDKKKKRIMRMSMVVASFHYKLHVLVTPLYYNDV